MLRVHGNVVGKTQIRDLGISLAYEETKDILEEDYRKSIDLKRALAAGFVRVERVMEKKPRGTQPVYSDQISDLDTKITALKDFMVQTQRDGSDEERLNQIETKLDSLSDLLTKVLQQQPKVIERVVERTDVKLQAYPVKTTEEPFYIPQIRSDGISAKITADKAVKTDTSIEETLKSLKGKIKGDENDK